MLPGPLTPARVLLTLDAVGGVWRHVVDLAGALRDRGIACRLAGFGPPPDPARIRAEGSALHGIDLIWTDQPLDWLADRPAALSGVAPCIERLAMEWHAALLHLSLPSQAAELAGRWPVVVSAHSCMATWWQAVRGGPLPADWGWRRDLDARGLARADRIVVPSVGHGAALQAVHGPLPHLVAVANAHAGRSEPGSKKPFILAAGRWWDPAKNAQTLDAAAAGALWPVLMAGPRRGPEGAPVDLRHVSWVGELDPPAMRELTREAAIFASPSVYEPFGLAVLEAAAEGAALVLADIPTFRELWGGAATFVPPRDAAAWRCALDRLAGDEVRRRRLGRLAGVRARQFSPARQVDRLADVYRAALERTGPAPGIARSPFPRVPSLLAGTG